MSPKPYAPRSIVIELCERLGHDPNRITRIVIDPKAVTFEYSASLVDDQDRVVTHSEDRR